MVDTISKDNAVEIMTAQGQAESEKAQPSLPHSHIILIPHPSDDPRDPLVCLLCVTVFVAIIS